MDIAKAQQLLWEGLDQLTATGPSGYEGFLEAVLHELTGQPFHLVKSGSQGGSDVRSEPSNLARVSLEAKHYRSNTRLSLDSLLRKLTDASTATAPSDLWILATTTSVDISNREKLKDYGDSLGVGVIVWDWPSNTDALCDLAAVCGYAPNVCRSYMSGTKLDEALEVIRGHVDFDSKASYWRQRLIAPDVGYATGRDKCGHWLQEAQGSLANAKSRLGGHHNLKSSDSGVVRRDAVMGELAAWFNDRKAGVAALIGDEGMGNPGQPWSGATSYGSRTALNRQ